MKQLEDNHTVQTFCVLKNLFLSKVVRKHSDTAFGICTLG